MAYTNRDALRGMFTLITGENPPQKMDENYLNGMLNIMERSSHPEPLPEKFAEDIAKDLADGDYAFHHDMNAFPVLHLPSVLHYCLYSSAAVLEKAQPPFGMHPLCLMCEDTFLLCLHLMFEARDKNMCDVISERLFRAVIAGVATFFEDVEKDVTTILRLCLPHMTYTYNWIVAQPWFSMFRSELGIRFTPQARYIAECEMYRVWADASAFIPFTPFAVSPSTTRDSKCKKTKTQVAHLEEPTDTTSWGSLPGTPDDATTASSTSPPLRFA